MYVCMIVYLRGSTVYCESISYRAELEQCHVKVYHTESKKQKPNLSKWQYRSLQRGDQMRFFFSLIFWITSHYLAPSLIFSSAEPLMEAWITLMIQVSGQTRHKAQS